MSNPSPGPYPTYQSPVVVVNPGGTAATWSLICGILGYLCLPGLGAILAVVLGFVSKSEARRYRQSASGAAIAGIVLGLVQLGLIAAFALLWIAATIIGAASSRAA